MLQLFHIKLMNPVATFQNRISRKVPPFQIQPDHLATYCHNNCLRNMVRIFNGS